ncbi:MAG TPA: hypothetical protein VMH81_39880 [Bryobacteraceae bacterium]|nr:hypothetical protein [Bryobacteraceae bacterium]
MSQRSRLGHWLVGAQAAIAVALAVVSGLLAGSVRTLSTGVNFEPTHVALMRLRPRLLKHTPHRAQRFQREAIQRLEHTPGVESASAAPSASSSRNRARSSLPLTRTSSTLPGAASARGWRPAPRTRLFGG